MDRIVRDTDRDFFLTAEQAVDYGIVDEVLAAKRRSQFLSVSNASPCSARRARGIRREPVGPFLW